MEFKDFNIDANLLKAVEKMGFNEPTEIQKLVIGKAKAGKDIIAASKTGTGKTAAFGIPLIESLDFDDEALQALIITPTRELALQVTGELNKLLFYYRTKAVALYGGEEITKQIKRLKSRPLIVVATPGRLMDHMRRHTVKTGSVKSVVLDEADEMLSMGFDEDVMTILSQVPPDRQIMLFSATITKRVWDISKKFMHSPEQFKVKSKTVTVDKIKQYYFQVEERDKLSLLCKILDGQKPESCIIFGKTKRRVDELIGVLKDTGYRADGIHGDLRQEKRGRILDKFKRGELNIFVATDVAARGLDIENVTHVINFDLPQDAELYVHRIGRTGRAGNSGISYTFAGRKELFFIDEVEKFTLSKIQKLNVPTDENIRRAVYEKVAGDILGKADKINNKALLETAQKLLEASSDGAMVLAAALEELSSNEIKAPVGKLSDEKPMRRPKSKFRSVKDFKNKAVPRRNFNKKLKRKD